MENNNNINANKPLNNETVKRNIANKRMAQKSGGVPVNFNNSGRVGVGPKGQVPRAPTNAFPPKKLTQQSQQAQPIDKEAIREKIRQNQLSRAEHKKDVVRRLRERKKLRRSNEHKFEVKNRELLQIYLRSKKQIENKIDYIDNGFIKFNALRMKPLLINSVVLYGLPIRRVRALLAQRAHSKRTQSYFSRQSKTVKTFILLLVFILFAALAAGTYVITNKLIIKNQINDEDIKLLENVAEGEHLFSDPVDNYVYGQAGGVQRGLRVNNTSKNGKIYIAFKMDVVEIVSKGLDIQEIPIEIEAYPIFSGDKIENTNNTKLWTVKTFDDGTTYYYSNKISTPNTATILFKSYDIKIKEGADLKEFELADKKIKVTVTVYMHQEVELNQLQNSQEEVWRDAPGEWMANLS